MNKRKVRGIIYLLPLIISVMTVAYIIISKFFWDIVIIVIVCLGFGLMFYLSLKGGELLTEKDYEEEEKCNEE